jgi:hypothetical protein
MEMLGDSSRTGWACQNTLPAEEGESPVNVPRRVDLRQPDEPRSATIWPG